MTKKYLFDASVILSYLLGETPGRVDKIKRLVEQSGRKKIKLLSSTLLPLEVANGLRFSLKDEPLAILALETFLKLPIDYLPFTQAQHHEILTLAYQLGTTVYDTSYHVLAKAHQATFITCYQEYFQKAKVLEHIELI